MTQFIISKEPYIIKETKDILLKLINILIHLIN